MQMLDGTDGTDGGFETIEHSSSAAHPNDIPADMQGWFILLHDADGEVYDEIGPFDTKEEAEAAQDIMSFAEAA
jgi:hypothetical protein